MFCPACGRAMTGPSAPNVAFPMYFCAADGIVFDRRRESWYALPEVGEQLNCPSCGAAMETEPKDAPVRMFFCYQCGVTFDRQRNSFYGLSFHLTP